jgi:hypothetical protein
MVDPTDVARFPSPWVRSAVADGVRFGCAVPLFSHNRPLGALSVVSLREAAFNEEDRALLEQCAGQIAIAVENALAYREIESLKNKLTQEKSYLEDEIRTETNFEEIIGASRALEQILRQVETVAPTDSTVLIRGESGTGKELIARAIHNLSSRRERTLAASPPRRFPTRRTRTSPSSRRRSRNCFGSIPPNRRNKKQAGRHAACNFAPPTGGANALGRRHSAPLIPLHLASAPCPDFGNLPNCGHGLLGAHSNKKCFVRSM